MKILFWGLIFFCLSFISQLIIWKIHLPKNQIKALFKIFFGTFIIYIFILNSNSNLFGNFCFLVPHNLAENLQICILFTSLVLVYIITYSAIEADSPSLLMVLTIAKAGGNGLNKEKLYEILDDGLLIKPRIRDLVNAKMVYIDRDRYKLTAKGILFVRIFIFYRKLLNLPKGG